MKNILLITAIVLMDLMTFAKAPWANAEHMLYVRIDTDPSDAAILTVPARDDAVTSTIGHTPLVVPLEMNWARSYLMKSWPKLTVSTTSGIATNEYDPKTKEHTVFLTFILEKPGYIRQVVQPVVAVLQKNENADDWDHMLGALPENQPIRIKLTVDTNVVPAQSESPFSATVPPTIIVASGSGASTVDIGTLLIQGPSGAPAYIDGIPAGKAPVRIMLPSGKHLLGTLQNGKQTAVQEITIEAGKTITATLAPPAER